jgi:hypothetical protein
LVRTHIDFLATSLQTAQNMNQKISYTIFRRKMRPPHEDMQQIAQVCVFLNFRVSEIKALGTFASGQDERQKHDEHCDRDSQQPLSGVRASGIFSGIVQAR